MQVVKVSASIRFSKDIGGSWKSVELAAEAAINHGEDWYQSQSQLYSELGQQLRDLWPGNGKGISDSTKSNETEKEPPKSPEPTQSTPVHYCELHGVSFKQRQKDGQIWYSHQIKGTREWCNESI